jgi:hypothetical protein
MQLLSIATIYPNLKFAVIGFLSSGLTSPLAISQLAIYAEHDLEYRET